MTDGAPVAAVDCGTNSTRLLVADAGGRELARLMRITRLGEGVDSAGDLAPAAIERTLAVLGEYRSVMDRLGVGRVRAIATSAARDARSAGTFLDAAESVLGARPEILDGESEGRLAFAGATRRLPSSGAPYLVVDIGGGSTEVALGPGPVPPSPPPVSPGGGPVAAAPFVAVSLDIGCVRVTERYLAHDPPLASELDEAAAAVSAELSRVAGEVPGIPGAATMVGLAGTVTTLAGVAAGVGRHDPARTHHMLLSRNRVEGLLAEMAAETRQERLARPGMEPGRVDVIVGGALVLAQAMSSFGFAECLVSEEDILDGLAATLLGAERADAEHSLEPGVLGEPSLLARSLAARGRAAVAERLALAEALAAARRECTSIAERLEDLRTDASKALGALSDDLGRATSELAETKAELADAVAERDDLATRLADLSSTRLFRWSAPLRRLYGLARRFR